MHCLLSLQLCACVFVCVCVCGGGGVCVCVWAGGVSPLLCGVAVTVLSRFVIILLWKLRWLFYLNFSFAVLCLVCSSPNYC